MIALLRSIAFAILFYPGTVVAVLGAFVSVLFGPRVMRPHAVAWARYYLWCARVALGIRYRLEGEVPRGRFIYAVKHQSMYETLAVLVIMHQPAVVVKRELADLPFWGRAARFYGVIPVDRSGSASALKTMLRAARAALADGRGIVIFPEGTRVLPGEQPPLRAGFAGLYKMLGVPVIPVAMNSGRLVPKGFVKHAGTITFRFAAPIPPGLPREEAEARVHAAINVLDEGC